MHLGWLVLWIGPSLGPAWASDDVGAILSDLTSAQAPCAGEIKALDAAVAARPDHREPRLARGVCLYRLGRLERAREDLNHALASPATVAVIEPLVVGAILAGRAGEEASARARLDRAAELGGASDPQVLRGRILVQGSLGDLPGAWMALDAALVRSAEDPVLRVAATELIALDPDGATERARAAVGRRVKTVTRHNRASGWLNAGQPAACVQEAEGALGDADPEDVDGVAALHVLAWRCGVAAQQVGAATRHLKSMGRTALKGQPPGTVIAHVRLLRDAGEVKTALKLLGLVQAASEVDRRDVATLQVGLRTMSGDLDGALGWAATDASAVSRAKLAKALHAAGRTAEAVTLLDQTCPLLDDVASCEAWREHLRSKI